MQYMFRAGYCGKRTQHGIPLEKIKILGRNGNRDLRSWMKEVENKTVD
jgi:hypothetical protein